MAAANIRLPVHDVEAIRKIEAACRVVADVLQHLREYVVPGAVTVELDAIAEDFIRTRGAEPAFKGYEVDTKVYPYTLCVSIDEEVVHGMPSQRVLKPGQIVSVDVGVKKDGYFGDSAYTFAVGEISEEKQRLLDVTQESLRLGIEQATDGHRVYDIARAVQTCVENQGFSVVRELVGHGIGQHLHEEPPVPNFVPGLLHRNRYPNAKLQTGMALAIEPMVNLGLFHVHTARDGWTVYAADGKPSAHFEHTIVIDGATPRILTEW
ncbi:MAG: type I methionyl aminopeptidase [Candidatus Kapabacteria bacterium]|nr:type I methionyl aminopeptidase [Candidatus Kapabacteria bacterium]